MARVRSTDSKFEIMLRRRLWSAGLRYRKNDPKVFGKPDVCFRGKKIAVFIDSEFWHGKDYPDGRNIPKTNTDFWRAKIERNISRDNLVSKTLESQGWKVIRIWSKDLTQNCGWYVELITSLVKASPQD